MRNIWRDAPLWPDARTINERLRDAGYSHCRDAHSGTDYCHTLWRTDDGALIGRMDAKTAVDFLEGTRNHDYANPGS